jgi:hypothetical protein
MSFVSRLPALRLLLGWCILLCSGCQPTVLGPTSPSGYRIILPEASQALRLHPLVLTVRVTDVNGHPVDDVPVQFHIPPTWASMADVTPASVTTQQGQASTTFRARTAGQMAVEITVEDRTDTVRIQVLGVTPRF